MGILRLVGVSVLLFCVGLDVFAEEVADKEGDFIQRRWLKILEEPLISQGRFAIYSAGDIQWVITEPFEITYTFRSDVLEVQEFGENRVVSRKQEPMLYGFFSFFSRIFQSNREQVAEWFIVTSQQIDANGIRRVQLLPKKLFMKKAFSRVDVVERDGEVQSVSILESEGDRLELIFSYSASAVAEGE